MTDNNQSIDGNGIIPPSQSLSDQIKAKIKALTEARDKFVLDANAQVSFTNGQIAANQEILAELEKKQEHMDQLMTEAAKTSALLSAAQDMHDEWKKQNPYAVDHRFKSSGDNDSLAAQEWRDNDDNKP